MEQQVTPGRCPSRSSCSTSLLPMAAPHPSCPWLPPSPAPGLELPPAHLGSSRACVGLEQNPSRRGLAAPVLLRSLVLPLWLFPTTALRGSQQPSVTATLGTGAGEGVGISQLCPGTSTGWIHAWLGERSAGGEKYPAGLGVSGSEAKPRCSSTQRGILQEGLCRWFVQIVVGELLKTPSCCTPWLLQDAAQDHEAGPTVCFWGNMQGLWNWI